jgi:hypothetical protein
MRSAKPIRESLRASALETVAMAARLVELEEVAAATFELLDRIDCAQDMPREAAALYNAETRELINLLASSLAALGYEITNEETQDQETSNAGSTAVAE